MTEQPVPFLDLVTPHRELEDELVAAFGRRFDPPPSSADRRSTASSASSPPTAARSTASAWPTAPTPCGLR